MRLFKKFQPFDPHHPQKRGGRALASYKIGRASSKCGRRNRKEYTYRKYRERCSYSDRRRFEAGTSSSVESSVTLGTGSKGRSSMSLLVGADGTEFSVSRA